VPARRRHLGQNFLQPAWAEHFVESADLHPGDLVIEVGAGSGSVTFALARHRVDVIALELDSIWAERLKGVARSVGGSRIRVVRADALSFPLPTRPFRVVGNLPFV